MADKPKVKLRHFNLVFWAAGMSWGALFSLPAHPKDDGQAQGQKAYYDELRDEKGEVRPQYKAAYEAYQKLKPSEHQAVLNGTKKDFRGDNTLDPLPRIITLSEFQTLRAGIEQRAAALRNFLQDYYAGRSRFEKVIPKEIVTRIVARTGESGYLGSVRPEQIAFPYGPDVMRAADGSWRVIEDNTGYIGGPGDLKIARESLMRHMPDYARQLTPLNDPMDYYRTLIDRARQRAIPKDGKIVIFMVPPYPDNEDPRLKKIMSDLGVEVVTPRTRDKLVVSDEGVFVKTSSRIARKGMERVGYIFVNEEHHWVDAYDPGVREMLARTKAKDILDELSTETWMKEKENAKTIERLKSALVTDSKTGKINLVLLESTIEKMGDTSMRSLFRENRANSIRGLLKAAYHNQVALNYSPGVDFVGDKEFYSYVDDLVRLYTGQEPIVKNLETFRFAALLPQGASTLDQEVWSRIFKGDSYKKYVIKAVDGRGGDAVWIGPKTTPEQIEEVKSKVQAEPERFIAQPFTHLSVVEDRIVDLRMITDVGPKDIYVSTTPWGRGIPLDGDGKVNLSQHGREFAVLVVPDPNPLEAPGDPAEKKRQVANCLKKAAAAAAH